METFQTSNFSKQLFTSGSFNATLKLIINIVYLLLFSDTDASEQPNGECVTDAKEASVCLWNERTV